MHAPQCLQAVLFASIVAAMIGCQDQPDPAAESQSSSALPVNNVSARKTPAGDETKTPEQHATHATSSQQATPSVRPTDASGALAALMEGNLRFATGKSIHPHESADYRASLANEQHPFATVLTCSDSRVTPVLIFDQGIGDLFVIRVAGNVVDEDVAGSIEYAVDHLSAKLLVVLGHENCGAITAAYHAFIAKDMREREPHEIESLLMRIQPALDEVDRSKPSDAQIAQGIEANVRQVVETLLRIPDLQTAQSEGRLKIVGAIYSIRTGKVRILDM